MNIASYFLDRNLAEGYGPRTALVCADRTVTYTELADLAGRAGDVLRLLGVRPGQRVLLALSDGVEFVACWYGAQKIGAVTAEVYTFLTAKDYAYFMDYTEAGVVVVDAVTLGPVRAALDLLRETPTLLAVGVPEAELTSSEVAWEPLMAAASPDIEPAQVALDDVALWKFTTGSTGAPKACVHPARSPLESFRAYAREVLDIRPDDLVLAVPKLFFGYARDLVALFPFGVGGAGVVFPERSTAELIFRLIARHRPTILVNVPTMLSAMLAAPEAERADLSCLRLITSAGEALPAELHRRWDERFRVPVVDGLGSSEAYHIYLSNRPGHARYGSVGRPVPGYAARVVSGSGAELADGEIGTLEVSGPTVALEYWGDPERTARTFRHRGQQGTVLTGDLCSRDADGCFFHHGRADDLLKVGGVFVAPAEIEHCLAGHPDVLECGVVGYTAEGLERARAYVVVRREATVSERELIAFARSRLAGHKRPREVRFVAALPRTANGKLDRRALRSWSGR